MLTTRDFLIRGLLAGLFAGFLTFGVAYFVGEPSVDASIAIEEAGADEPAAHADEAEDHDHEAAGHSHAHGDEDEGTEVPRGLQSTLGLLTATGIVGTVLGGLTGVLTALGLGRLGSLGVRGTALATAATGFVVLYFVPYLIYPPNPPAVGSGDTIGERTGLYFAMVAISVVAAIVAAVVGSKLKERVGGWHAALAVVAGYAVVMVVALALMPRYNEVGDDFPGQLLFEFRIGSLLTSLALWTFIGLGLAELGQRLVAGVTPPRAREPEGALTA